MRSGEGEGVWVECGGGMELGGGGRVEVDGRDYG